MINVSCGVVAFLLSTVPFAASAPPSVVSSSPSGTSTLLEPSATVVPISLNPNEPLWNASAVDTPQGIRGPLGATVIGPTNPEIVKQNPDLLAPPTTDAGSVPNAKWSFSLSHNKLLTGGWAREQSVADMPIAANMAGVNLRLKAGSIRELHWHTTAEWAYIMKGTTQVTSVDSSGRNYIANAGPGDLWYFPAGIPHSVQATADDPDGAEIVLVFPDGRFSDESTFMVTDWMSHVPVEVLAKNFQTDISAFSHIPSKQLYIFPGVPPSDSATNVVSPNGEIPNPFTFQFSKVEPTQRNGGTVKIVDSRTFTVSKEIAAAEVTVEPGAIRELHWHPTQDEWSFFLEGEARITIFAAQSTSRTFNYQAGDIGYVPASMGHYVENTGNTTLRYLEISKSPIFEDISLSNWLALTPPALVQAHLGFDMETIASLPKMKPIVVGPV